MIFRQWLIKELWCLSKLQLLFYKSVRVTVHIDEVQT